MDAVGIATPGLSMALALLQADGFWMPGRGSTTAGGVDWLFYFILAISAIFFIGIVVVMALFVFRYRARPGHREQQTASHNLPLELTWSIIPLLLVIVIFWFGFTTYLNQSTPPQNSLEVMVTAQKWNWLFTYANGWVDEELHVPAGRPVTLVMTSEDVIHSFYVPDFRLKKDVVPGRYTKAWFEAIEPGEHQIFCAEYCGTEHSSMLSRVVVHTAADYEQWLETAGAFYEQLPPAEAGAEMLRKFGCVQCHSVDGSAGTGPTLKDIYGQTHQFTDGTSAAVDENYIRDSILNPLDKVRQGYQGVMPTFQGKITDQEISWIIAAIKAYSGVEEPMPAEETGAEPSGEDAPAAEDVEDTGQTEPDQDQNSASEKQAG